MLLSRDNVRVGVVPGMMLICFASLQSGRDNIVDGKLPLRLCHAEELPVAFEAKLADIRNLLIYNHPISYASTQYPKPDCHT